MATTAAEIVRRRLSVYSIDLTETTGHLPAQQALGAVQTDGARWQQVSKVFFPMLST
jgi:hypothetical protein